MIEGIQNCKIVGFAENGPEAMKMVHKYHPQIVFSEIQLGHENGIDVCRAVKETYPDIVCNIISNYRNIHLMNKAFQAGVNLYILKPVPMETLIEACRLDESQSLMEDETLRELMGFIERRDFKKSYDACKLYIHHIYTDLDSSMHRTVLKDTASKLISLIPGMDSAQKKYYLQKYKLSSKILSQQVLAYCWLVRLVMEVFRQLCVMKYSQMNKVLQYIETNLHNDVSLTEISEYAEVSSGYLSRIFKKYYNTSVVDYIHICKILLAKEYMVSSDMNISDISFMLGYSEAGYFSKIFRKYEKMTPSAFSNEYS